MHFSLLYSFQAQNSLRSKQPEVTKPDKKPIKLEQSPELHFQVKKHMACSVKPNNFLSSGV